MVAETETANLRARAARRHRGDNKDSCVKTTNKRKRNANNGDNSDGDDDDERELYDAVAEWAAAQDEDDTLQISNNPSPGVNTESTTTTISNNKKTRSLQKRKSSQRREASNERSNLSMMKQRSRLPSKPEPPSVKTSDLQPPHLNMRNPEPSQPQPPLPRSPPSQWSLHVTQIPYEATEMDIRDHFSSRGCLVSSIRMVYDYYDDDEDDKATPTAGSSSSTNKTTRGARPRPVGKKRTFRGVAFCDVMDVVSYNFALKELHQSRLLGRRINVRPTRTVQELSTIVQRTKQMVQERRKQTTRRDRNDTNKRDAKPLATAPDTDTDTYTMANNTSTTSANSNLHNRSANKLESNSLLPKKQRSNLDRVAGGEAAPEKTKSTRKRRNDKVVPISAGKTQAPNKQRDSSRKKRLTKKERNRRAAILSQQRKQQQQQKGGKPKKN